MKRHEYPERIVSAFLTNYRMSDVIRDAGISKTTAYKYKNDPEFQNYLRLRKSQILTEVVDRMKARMLKDLDRLDSVIDDPKSSGQVVINAIHTKWSHMREWTTTVDIINRLEALESLEKDTFNTF